MTLRNAHLAVVDRQKVVDYLLNAAHPDNGGKAEWLVAALLAVAQAGEVVETAQLEHGEKSVVEGWLEAHTEEGRRRRVRTVWIVDAGHEAPRLVTAYPGRE